MFRKTWAEIRQDHLQHNIELIRKYFPKDTFFCPMVKANAYGHGDTKLGQVFQSWNLPNMGVCLIEEGLLLRQLGVRTPVLVFRGFDQVGARALIHAGLTPIVSSWDQLEILIQMKQPVGIHLKFDTGMNRLGFVVEDAEKVLARFKSQRHLKLEGVLTHMYQSEDAQDPKGQTVLQLGRFDQIVEVFQNDCGTFHALNSGGIISKIEMMRSNSSQGILFERNWGLRPGLLIYGYNPVVGSALEFKPAMTLKSHTSVIRHVKTGEGVSYNHTWKAMRDSQVAVVPIGYADGWHRFLSNRTTVLWNGQRAPMVGNVCMDYLMVDVTGLPVEPENEVVFFGQSKTGATISAAEVAKHAQTIPWEILTSIGERVPRIYV